MAHPFQAAHLFSENAFLSVALWARPTAWQTDSSGPQHVVLINGGDVGLIDPEWLVIIVVIIKEQGQEHRSLAPSFITMIICCNVCWAFIGFKESSLSF